MLGPNFRQPAAPVADKWLEADNPAVDSNRQEFRDWWTVFNDPVLTRLIQLAYSGISRSRLPGCGFWRRGRNWASLSESSIRNNSRSARR